MDTKKNILKKIALIGPVYPYRGGISHYTGAMYQALIKKYSVEVISFKLQYPRFLFKKEQKDFLNQTFKINDTKFIINTINPFSWVKTAKYIKELKVDLVIFQWWHPYFAPCYWGLMALLADIRKILICHNVFPHERFPLDKTLTKTVLKKGNGFIVQSCKDEEDLNNIVKNMKYKRSVHPTYNIFKFAEMDKETARNRLDLKINEKVILFFGFVREYKGLKHLINAIPKVKLRYPDIKLLIVGEFEKDKKEYINLIESSQVKDCIKIYDNYVPDADIQQYFMASDLVVLPYESATQSGIVQMAYGFEKPVIVTKVGGLPDVVVNNKTGYVVKPKSSEHIANAIIRYYEENKEEEFSVGVKTEAYKYSWERMSDLIEELYKEI